MTKCLQLMLPHRRSRGLQALGIISRGEYDPNRVSGRLEPDKASAACPLALLAHADDFQHASQQQCQPDVEQYAGYAQQSGYQHCKWVYGDRKAG